MHSAVSGESLQGLKPFDFGDIFGIAEAMPRYKTPVDRFVHRHHAVWSPAPPDDMQPLFGRRRRRPWSEVGSTEIIPIVEEKR
ncbi:MAG: hypothetical protein WBD10_16225 [Acidobacteriaceae bacterium]